MTDKSEESEVYFMSIADRFCIKYKDVHLGRMMSSPGLKYKDKVFAFYFKQSMGFRLGADFDPKKIKLRKFKPLSPFKTKPPLKGWFVLEEDEIKNWEKLCEIALLFTKTLTR